MAGKMSQICGLKGWAKRKLSQKKCGGRAGLVNTGKKKINIKKLQKKGTI